MRRLRRQAVTHIFVLVKNIIVTTASMLDMFVLIALIVSSSTYGLYSSLMVAKPLRFGAKS